MRLIIIIINVWVVDSMIDLLFRRAMKIRSNWAKSDVQTKRSEIILWWTPRINFNLQGKGPKNKVSKNRLIALKNLFLEKKNVLVFFAKFANEKTVEIYKPSLNGEVKLLPEKRIIFL